MSFDTFDFMLMRTLRLAAYAVYYVGSYSIIGGIFLFFYELYVWLRDGAWGNIRGYDILQFTFGSQINCNFSGWIGVDIIACKFVDFWGPCFLVAIGIGVTIVGIVCLIRVEQEINASKY